MLYCLYKYIYIYCLLVHKSTVFIHPVILNIHYQSSAERQKLYDIYSALQQTPVSKSCLSSQGKFSLALKITQFQTLSTVLLSVMQESWANFNHLSSITFLLLLSPPLHNLSYTLLHATCLLFQNTKWKNIYRFHNIAYISFMPHIILYIQLIAPPIHYQVK